MQNELMDVMGKAVLEEIISRITTAKCYAIILDCAPDISRKEQLLLVIR